jgi:hypothetical protein
LVDDPDRVGPVAQLGVDETSMLKANREHATVYVTGMVDLTARRMIDMVEGTRPLTCADGARAPIRAGWPASRSSRQISRTPTGRVCHRTSRM